MENGIESATGWMDLMDRSALLEGICDDLINEANQVLDGCMLLKNADGLPFMPHPVDDMMPQMMLPFRQLSSADPEGLKELGYTLKDTAIKLTNNIDVVAADVEAPNDVTDARDYLSTDNWRGNAANEARRVVSDLEHAFINSTLAVSALMGTVGGARATIETARSDLKELSQAFYDAADQYHREKEATDNWAFGEIISRGFIDGIAGYILDGPKGAYSAAVSTIGNGFVDEATEEQNTNFSGGSAEEIAQSFIDGGNNITGAVQDAADRIVDEVQRHIADLDAAEPVPAAPDLSVGQSSAPPGQLAALYASLDSIVTPTIGTPAGTAGQAPAETPTSEISTRLDESSATQDGAS